VKLTDTDSVRDINAAMQTANAFAHVFRTTIVASFSIDDDEGITEVMEKVGLEFTVEDHPYDVNQLADFLTTNVGFALKAIEHLRDTMFDECVSIAGRGLDDLNPEDFKTDDKEEDQTTNG
jgi:hypothetical protein